MGPEMARATLSTLRPLASPGDVEQVAKIVERLLALYPGKGANVADSVAEDWVRHLQKEPLASIWAAYEKTIVKPGTFAPSLGDFLARVQSHSNMVNRLRISLGAAA